MEGLEISELMFSRILKNNLTERIDSEFFLKEFISFEDNIYKKSYKILHEIGFVKGGKRLPVNEFFSHEGIPYIRAESAIDFVDWRTNPKISQSLFNKLKAYQTKYNDVLITIVGNGIGNVGIVKFHLSKCILTENCSRIVLKDILPEVLFIYLKSRYGQTVFLREKVGTAQPKLALERLRNFKIPIFSNYYQQKIESTVTKAHSHIDKAKHLYTQAESLLLDTLGLRDFKPSQEKVSIKKLSESFEKTGRLDAEYYQRKYEECEEFIFGYNGGWGKISESCHLKDDNFTPINTDCYSYIELSDIDNFGDISSNYKTLGKDLPSRARRMVCQSDVLISSIEGSLQSCAVVPRWFEGALCSTGFYVLKSNIINSETLLILFKTRLIQSLLKKNCSGTILTAINKLDLLDIPIPIIDKDIQTKIKLLIQESFKLRAESKKLLDLAKQSVETAIEQDEESAINILRNSGHHD